MWQSVATYVATFFETEFPYERQRRLTLGVLFAIIAMGILLLALIAWSDMFYA